MRETEICGAGPVESLETRVLFGAHEVFGGTWGTLKYTGDTPGDIANNVSVYLDWDGEGTTLFDDVDGDGVVDEGELYGWDEPREELIFNTGNDRDVVRVYLESGWGIGGYGSDLKITANLGSGDDGFVFAAIDPQDVPREVGDVVSLDAAVPPLTRIDGANVDLNVTGGNGDDELRFDFTSITVGGSHIDLITDAGAHDDRIDLVMPNDIATTEDFGSGDALYSTFTASIETGTGTNLANLRAGGVVRESTAVRIELDGDGIDTLTGEFASTIPDGFFELAAQLGGRNDRFDLEYDFGPNGIGIGASSLLAIKADGGDGNDVLIARTDPSKGNLSKLLAGTLEFELDGQKGDDDVQVRLDARALEPTFVQQFADGAAVIARLNGGAGRDRVAFDQQVKGAPLMEVALAGGLHDDRLILAVNDVDPVTAILYPIDFGGLRINGGSGLDSWDEDGNHTVFVRTNVEKQNDNLEPNDPEVIEL